MLDHLLDRVYKFDIQHKKAIIDVDSLRSHTYDELFSDVIKLRKELEHNGIRKGSHVVLIGNNTNNFIVCYLSLTMIKVTIIPISQNTSEYELKKLIKDCDANAIVNTSSNKYTQLGNYPHAILCSITSELWIVSKTFNLKKDPKALVFMRTSGSNSEPKIVMHSIDSLIGNALSHGRGVGYSKEEKSLVILPITFSFAHTSQMLSVLLFGGTLYLSNSESFFSPKKFKELIDRFHITSTCLVAIHLLKWSKQAKFKKLATKSLKHVCYAGGPTPLSMINILRQQNPKVKFLQAYGLTEAGPRVSVVSPNDRITKLHHVGKAVENITIQIRDQETHQVLKPYETGEIYVKSPFNMKGYYKNTDLTNKVLNNQWLSTGDIGYLSEEGYLHVIGRIKNLIITMGNNVYPEEIEEYLLEHEQIVDAYSYGVKDKVAEEIISVDVVLKNPLLNKKEIIDFCRQGLTSYKIPRIVNIKTSIKRNRRGKLIRYEG